MISASSLVRNCGYVRVLKAEKPRAATTVEAAERGTAFHAASERWVRDGEYPDLEDAEIQGWIDLLASQWTPPLGAEVEIAWGLDLDGGYVDVDEPEPHVYVARDGRALLTAGRADIAFERGRALYVVDWKTGKWPVTPAIDNLQVNAAGIALAQRYGFGAYVPAIYYVRDGFFDDGEVVGLDEAPLADVRAAALLDNEPRVGDWCGRCWEKKACRAYQEAA